MTQERILVVSHAHPDFSKGGGEIAAYNLFKELKERKGVAAMFLAAHTSDRPESARDASPFSARGDGDEILFDTQTDHFRLGNAYLPTIWRDFRRLLERFRPTVVHFHHYFRLGVEMIREVKNYDPNCVVVLTLHEYLAICNQNGQMIKTNGQLCFKSNPVDCNRCMPQFSQTDFFLRERYIKSFFDLVDCFISPSHFLIERYAQWGLPLEKMVFLENGQHLPDGPPQPRTLVQGEGRSRFAYFGQINPFKGVDVLLEAVARVPKSTRKKIAIEIHGGGLENQSEEYRARISALHAEVAKTVKFYGTYEPQDLPRLILRNDWVLMPSIWWENSPLVIQEAFKFGRPVICGDIGGMAEKVKHGVSGLTVRRSNPSDLAETLTEAVENPTLWDELHAQLPMPPSMEQWAEDQLGLYELFRPRASVAAA